MLLNGTTYHNETPAQVAFSLENARATDRRIRLFYGDKTTGIPWAEEFDIIGTVGRSTGTIKIPLLIHNSRSMGGPAILDHCIIAIQSSPGRYSYTADNYQREFLETCLPDHPHGSIGVRQKFAPFDIIARFRESERAARFIEFHHGLRWRPW